MGYTGERQSLLGCWERQGLLSSEVAQALTLLFSPMVAGRQGAGKRKREDAVAEAAKVQSPVAAWISQARTPKPRLQQHATASLQQQSGDLLHHMSNCNQEQVTASYVR